MPTPFPSAPRVMLDQPDAGIYRNVELIAWPGQEPAGRQSGPNAAMVRLGLEEQENEQIRQLAQQYGTDYDGLVDAVTQVNPKRGFEMKSALENGRKEAAARSIEETKGSLAKIDMGARWLQTAAEQPDLYPVIRGELLKQAGPAAHVYDQVLPQPDDPQLSDKLTKIVTGIALPTKDYLEVKAKAAQLYFDDKKVEGGLTLLAGSKTPEQMQHTAEIVTAGGLPKLLDTFTPEQAQALLTAKPAGKEANWQLKETMLNGKRTWVWANPQTLETKPAQGMGAPIAPQGSAGGGGGGQAGPGDLTPEGIEYAATIYRLTNKMPPLGMGKTPARGQIINKAAEQTRLLGQTPVAAVQRQAMLSADTKSLNNLQKLADAAGAYEQKALSQMDIVDSLSDKVSRTNIPLLNRAILAGKTEIAGDPNATLLLNAILTGTTEYAKIMAGGTGSAQAVTDSAQKEAQKLLNAAMSKGTLRQATALMRQEMGYTMQGYDAAMKHIQDRIGGQSSTNSPAAPVTLASPYDVTAPNGKTYHFDSKAKSDAFKKAAGIQ